MRFGGARRKFGKIILMLTLGALVSWGGYHLTNRLFALESIEVVGTNVSVVVDEERISTNLLFFPADRERAAILTDNPTLADVTFRKKFPHTLEIIPVQRVPFVRLKANGRLVLLDRTGVVLTDGDEGKLLPLVAVSVPLFRVGERLKDKRIAFALLFIGGMSASFPIESITDTEERYFRATSGKTDIFIPQDTDVNGILATLQTLISGFRIKGTLPTVVDLRFDKPIVKF